jgi:hypothetical protein
MTECLMSASKTLVSTGVFRHFCLEMPVFARV